MSKGKVAAQCCHAAIACYKRLSKDDPVMLRAWERDGQAKVTLKCAAEEELLDLLERATALGLCARCVRDAGRTQIAPNTRTVLAIGPGPVAVIDQVTSHLKLY